MRLKLKFHFLAIIGVTLLGGGYFYYQHGLPLPFSTVISGPKKLVKQQLTNSALSPHSVWDQEFLNHHLLIRDKITQFESGYLCQSLHKLDNEQLTHKELSLQLAKLGFVCEVRPLTQNPKALHLKYLKINDIVTDNPHEVGVAYQEICREQGQPQCAIRIKRDGFPLNKRSNPHSTKAVLLDEKDDAASFDNEAFKVSAKGRAIPKGPDVKFGLKKCPYAQKRVCDQWVDAVMEQAHPNLKNAIGTNLLHDK